jgi:hypothetical protein
VPNPSRFPILAPLGSEKICPLGSKERWELRAVPFGCNVSTVTFLTAVGSVLGTLAAIAMGFLVVWAGKRAMRSWGQGKLGVSGFTDWIGRGGVRQRGVRSVGDVEGNPDGHGQWGGDEDGDERRPLLGGE